jgi:hypothetical protein
MSEIKLCKNCKHEKREVLSYIPLIGRSFRTYSKCAHPEYSEVDLVTGGNQCMPYCSTMRSFSKYCGKEAKFFEEKN